MKIKSVDFSNFTSFDSLKISLSPNITVISGMNSSGKSNILKYLYCMSQTLESIHKEERNSLSSGITKVRSREIMADKLAHVFRPENGYIGRLSKRAPGASIARVVTTFDEQYDCEVSFSTQSKNKVDFDKDIRMIPFPSRSVFIPPKEIISATENFLSIYDEYHIAFEETYADLNRLLLLPRQTRYESSLNDHELSQTDYSLKASHLLSTLLNGEVKAKKNRFSLKTKEIGDIEMGLLAEGYRKLATLAQLIANGVIGSGTILFWDEPEANLNPKMMNSLVQAISLFACMGVQIILTTHSYFLMQEMDLFSRFDAKDMNINVSFVSLYDVATNDHHMIKADIGTEVSDLEHDVVMEEFEAMYNRGQEKLYANK